MKSGRPYPSKSSKRFRSPHPSKPSFQYVSAKEKQESENVIAHDRKFEGINRLLLGFAINLGNICQEIEDTAGILQNSSVTSYKYTFIHTYPPFVVVPRHQFHEVLVEGDTGLGIEDGGVGIAVQIGRNNVVLSVREYAWTLLVVDLVVLRFELTLELALCGLLQDGLDLIVSSTLLETDGQVNNGHVGCWDTH